jgi:hypothetical protein
LNPKNFFGASVLSGTYDCMSIPVPVLGEFAAFVLVKN